ncbi:AAA domain-containing protein [Bernardetia sp. MNP-M8]|uniref:AAA domain-containing protein n=1 Tax=Bernardetia sp. MNP-M8 TaxID=3127470 RepID=UPI0030CABF48
MQKHKLLEIYQRRLTNLSGKNRSLWLPKIYKNSFLDINELDFLLNKPAFSVVESLLANKKTIPLCQLSDARDSKNNQISRQLKGIERKTTSIFEESGAFDLYVGFPFIEGKLHDDTVVRCPLLFFPVTLEIKNRKWQITQRTDAGVSFNKALLLAYSHFNESEISESILEENFEEFPNNALEFLTQLYNYLEKSELEINFNQETFAQKLLPFFSQTKQDATNLFETGKLKLVSQAVLGLFPQAGSYLYQDYEKLINDEKTPQLEDFFHGDFTKFNDVFDGSGSFRETEYQDEILKNNTNQKEITEEEIFAPFALDASQEQVLKAVKNNNSFVVQGPPGTGKSQLICNLVSDFVAQGKKVLVVCQKRAALDVVQNRLNEIEISPFIALVHDFKQDRKIIYEQIQNHIQNLELYEKQNKSLNAIHLERNFLKISREIDSLTNEFEEYRTVFFDEKNCGKSIKELYLNADLKKEYTELSQVSSFVFDDEFDSSFDNEPSLRVRRQRGISVSKFKKNLKNYIRLQNNYENPSYILSERQSFAGFDEENKKEILALFTEIPNFKKSIESKFSTLLGKPISYDQAKKWTEKVPQWKQAVKELQDKNLWQIFKESRYYEFEQPEWLNEYIEISQKENIAASYANAEKKWLSQKEKDLLSYFSDGGMEKFLEQRTLKEANFLVQEYKKQKQSFLRKVWKRMAAPKAEKFTKELLEKYRRKDEIKNIDWLLKKISKRNSFELKMIAMQAVEWVSEPPSSIGLKKNELKNWFISHRKALALKLLLVELIEYSRIFLEKDITHQDLNLFLEEFVNLLTETDTEEKRWNQYLTESQINLLLNINNSEIQSEKLFEIKTVIDSDFNKLVELDTLKANFSKAELKTIEELKKYFSENELLNETEILNLFDNSVQISWINELENHFPILKTVGSQNWKENEERLKTLVAQKQQISADILRLKIKEKTYKDIEFNRLGNRTTYRDLEHQVKKKRSIWALRKLLSNYSDEIFRLLPCWLASPETVSAIFPLIQNFDLVIFDEASQCFAEKGIPALYRGKQSIIAGDEKQLPPHDLYQPRWEEDLDKIDFDSEIFESQSDKEINEEIDEIQEIQNYENTKLALEVDSLLDLGKNYLPSFELNGHYRSRFAELIAFSNYHFYGNRLKVVPDLGIIEEYQDSTPIEYLKVNGTWHQNQNQEEAERVVELVKNLIKNEETQNQFKSKSIGIITFNSKQQNLIRDLLEENLETIPEDLFIKNIENVQGDERDLIIFSVGYAPNMAGKFRLSFGSLSQAGGENRLNVAISRAREKIYVVSSIFPHQLPVLETHSLGAQLLKKYLSFAHSISEGKSWHQINFEDNIETPSNKITQKIEQSYFANLKNTIISTNQNSDIEFSQNTFSVMDLVMLSKNNTQNKEILAAIYTDDERYFASYSAKEFHVYMPMLLEKKGWKVKFFWSKDYFLGN